MSECGMAAIDLYAKYKTLDIVSIGCYTPGWDQEGGDGPREIQVLLQRERQREMVHQGGHRPSSQDQGGVRASTRCSSPSMTAPCAGRGRDRRAISPSRTAGRSWGMTSIPSAATDYSAALNDCKKSGAQVLFIWAYAPETSILLKQWADMEVPALPIGFIGAAEDPGFWKATNGKGAYTIVTLSETGNVPGNVTPLHMKFYDSFKKKWGVPPRSTGCVSAYEALFVLKDAIERAGTHRQRGPCRCPRQNQSSGGSRDHSL